MWKRPVTRIPLSDRFLGIAGKQSSEARALGLAELSDSDSAFEPPAVSLGLGSLALSNTIVELTAKVIARLIVLLTFRYLIRNPSVGNYGWFNVLCNFTAIVRVLLDRGLPMPTVSKSL